MVRGIAVEFKFESIYKHRGDVGAVVTEILLEIGKMMFCRDDWGDDS